MLPLQSLKLKPLIETNCQLVNWAVARSLDAKQGENLITRLAKYVHRHTHSKIKFFHVSVQFHFSNPKHGWHRAAPAGVNERTLPPQLLPPVSNDQQHVARFILLFLLFSISSSCPGAVSDQAFHW